MKTYVNDMDMRREGYIEGEKRGRAEGEKEIGAKTNGIPEDYRDRGKKNAGNLIEKFHGNT